MKITKLALITIAAAAATLALPATAHADSQNFQTPSGNIACTLDVGGVACDIAEYTYQVPPGPECAKHLKWGNRFTLSTGQPGAMSCHGDTLRVAGEQTLNYGQTISAGNTNCESQPSGVRCTDKTSGHFFEVSKDSYNLG
jgi:outer membrane protease